MNNLIIFLILLPLLANLVTFMWPRQGYLPTLFAAVSGSVMSAVLMYQIHMTGPQQHALGGWDAGLGITLRADALASSILLMAFVVFTAASVYANTYFSSAQQRSRFWPLWLMLMTAIAALLLSGDLFNLYVTLELLGLSAVALTALSDNRGSLQASLRYLCIGLLGSLVFLAGVALIYTAYGTLDLQQLSQVISAEPAAQVSVALLSAGLIIKSALFPMHFWLPSAHGSAPAPVSAALSALVVKVALYMMLRLWLDVFDPVITATASLLLAALGAIAILWGSWQALQAQRLKLLAAYSTLAQLGYLFLFFPIIMALPAGPMRDTAFTALLLLALTHGFAKSALFLSAGVIQQHAGHDRIADLGGTAQALPLTIFVIALSGVALIGLPPSGSFIAKWQLLTASIHSGQGWWIAVIATGSLLASAYTFRLLGHAFGPGDSVGKVINWGSEEIPALSLALLATLILGLGSASLWPFISNNSFIPGG